MSVKPLVDYLAHMRQAAGDACAFAQGMSKQEFLADKQLMDSSPDYVQAHPEVPWRSMRGMRNRIAHGYFEINLDVVWDTLQTALPELLRQLPADTDSADGVP